MSNPASSPAPTEATAAAPAPAATAAPTAGAAVPLRRRLEENRLSNQKRRRAWEASKEESTEVCGAFVGDFVQCIQGRVFSVVWACRRQNAVMTQCMKNYMATNSKEAAIKAGEEKSKEYEGAWFST